MMVLIDYEDQYVLLSTNHSVLHSKINFCCINDGSSIDVFLKIPVLKPFMVFFIFIFQIRFLDDDIQ